MKRAILLLAAALVAGCTAPGTRQADRYFILGMTQDSATSPRPATGVSVAPVSASAFYDTQDMVFSRSPGIRAYYQFNHWTERPQRTIQAQLAARIEADARVRPLVLRAHLDEIYHDAAASPGTARIELTAELVDPATRAVIARRSFKVSAPAASYDAPGAVHGFGQALGMLLDNLAAWIDIQAPRTLVRSPNR